MLGNWSVQWLNLNSQRKYPLTYDASGLDVTGSFQIPDDFLVSLYLGLGSGVTVETLNFYVIQIDALSDSYTVHIGYLSGSTPVEVARGSIPAAGFTANQEVSLTGVGNFTSATGSFVIGKLDNINLQPPGSYTFALATTRLEQDCVRPMLVGVDSVTVSTNGAVSPPLTGSIRLIAGTNITIVPISGPTPGIQINAIDGSGLNESCSCTNDTSVPIKRINGVAPTSDGDFTLLGDDCLQISTAGNGLQLSDLCSKPCCGCTELAVITQDLESLEVQATEISNFVNSLNAAAATMNLVVLGSRLNDSPCVTC